MWQRVAFNLREGCEADVVPCAADGGRCRTWESAGIREEKGSQCDRSRSPAPRFNGRSPALTAHTLPPLPTSFPLCLTHTHALSFSPRLCVAQPLVSAALSCFISPPWSAEREAVRLLGWLKVVRLGTSESAGDLRDKTALVRKIRRKISSSGDYLHHKTCGKRTVTLHWLHNHCLLKRCHSVY